MRPDETVIWREESEGQATACVMVSCCSGAELQLWRDGEIVGRNERVRA